MAHKKELDTLIADIQNLFSQEHKCSDENLKTFAKNITEQVQARLEAVQNWDAPRVRVSKLGTPNRKLWYELHDETTDRTIDASTVLKFMYGDIIEELVLLLAKEAGHTVEGEQGEIEVDGVIGHRDCIIDGVTCDVKSASGYSFKKFVSGKFLTDDPFGYVAQISTYATADNSPYGAFIVMNKETGELTVAKVDPMDMINPHDRIAEVKDVVSKDTPPPKKCYDPVPSGTSGNMELAKGCNYCRFKHTCWSDANNGQGLRGFKYAQGVKYLTEVYNTPRVDEVFE